MIEQPEDLKQDSAIQDNNEQQPQPESKRDQALRLVQDLYLEYVQLKPVPMAHPDHTNYELREEQLRKAIKEAQKQFSFTDEEVQIKGKEHKEKEENRQIVESLRRALDIDRQLRELNKQWKGFPPKVLDQNKPEDMEEITARETRDELWEERRELVSYLGSVLFKTQDGDSNKIRELINSHGERIISELTEEPSLAIDS